MGSSTRKWKKRLRYLIDLLWEVGPLFAWSLWSIHLTSIHPNAFVARPTTVEDSISGQRFTMHFIIFHVSIIPSIIKKLLYFFFCKSWPYIACFDNTEVNAFCFALGSLWWVGFEGISVNCCSNGINRETDREVDISKMYHQNLVQQWSISFFSSLTNRYTLRTGPKKSFFTKRIF